MNFTKDNLRLYAVTDRSWLRGQTLMQQVEQALLGGATLVQLREKELEESAFLQEAVEMTRLCHRFGVPLLINDNVEIARKSGADGVHVGQEDMEASAVRGILGSGMIVGVTAKTVEQAKRAQDAGADYLGSGAVFGSSTKRNAKPMTKETLREICAAVRIPVVAIGGITQENVTELSGTGICGVAVISAIYAQEDIPAAAKNLKETVKEMLAPQ